MQIWSYSFWIGLCAEEIHVCGEAAAVDFVTELMYTTGEEVEVSLINIYFFNYVDAYYMLICFDYQIFWFLPNDVRYWGY